MGRKRKAKDPDREQGSDTEDESRVKKRTTRGGGKKRSLRDLAFTEGDSSSDEDPNVCPVCGDRNDPNPTDNKNRMIGCDGSCEKWFHWTCVGINLTNKPGKKDDWFCKKCSSKKTEAGEWKPEDGDEEGLDVLPLRDQTTPVLKTLAEKKSYDSPVVFQQKSRGRPPGPPGSRSQNGRKSSATTARESWSTSGPKLPPGISVNPLVSGVTKPPSQISVDKEVRHRPSLPPSVSLTSLTSVQAEPGKVQHRLPPGISISKSSDTDSQSQQSPPQIPSPKPDPADVQLRKIPAGISVIPEGVSNNEDSSKDSFLTDLEDVGDPRSGSPEAKKENCVSNPVISSGIKLFKVKETEPQSSPNKKKTETERCLRERGQQVAKIKATIDEGDISDDELFGSKRVLYRKPKMKSSPSKESEPTPIEELLKDSFDDSNESKHESNPSPSQTKDDVLKNSKNSGYSQEKVSSSESAKENSEKVKETGENTRIDHLWEPVEDESGKKGLSLITKTQNAIVIKPYNNTGTSHSDESNENSSSRLDDAEKNNLKSKSSDHLPEESATLENQEMDLSQELRLSQDLPFITNLDDIINKSSVQSPKDEAEIQKIKLNLTADLEGSRAIPASNNGSLIQQSPLSLPNTRFSHQLPQTILQPPRPQVSINTISLSSPSLSSTNGKPLIPKIDDYIDGDTDDGNTTDKISLKVLKPGELNTKVTAEAKTSSVATPTQLIKVSSSFSPSNLQVVQSPSFRPNIVGSPAGTVGQPGQPPAFMVPLNRLQSPQGLAGAGVIRISTPSHVSLGGGASAPVTSLVMSHPAPTQVSSPGPIIRPPASPRGRGRGGPRVRGPRPPVRPGMRMVRPGGPGGPRMMRPRGPPPPGMRLVRPGGSPRGVRPGGPRPVRPPVRPPASVAPPQQPGMAPVPIPKPLKVEYIDLSDDEEPEPAPAKSATLQKLNNLGISISRQKAPQIPQGVRLPPGISLSAPGSSSKRTSSSSGAASNGESSRKRVSLDHNVASALSTVSDRQGGSEPKQKVELELNSKQMEALRTLGFL